MADPSGQISNLFIGGGLGEIEESTFQILLITSSSFSSVIGHIASVRWDGLGATLVNTVGTSICQT